MFTCKPKPTVVNTQAEPGRGRSRSCSKGEPLTQPGLQRGHVQSGFDLHRGQGSDLHREQGDGHHGPDTGIAAAWASCAKEEGGDEQAKPGNATGNLLQSKRVGSDCRGNLLPPDQTSVHHGLPEVYMASSFLMHLAALEDIS